MTRRALALILSSATLSLGCSSGSGDAPAPAATGPASAAPTTAAVAASATAAPTATAATSAAVAAAEPPVYPPRKVPGGMLVERGRDGQHHLRLGGRRRWPRLVPGAAHVREQPRGRLERRGAGQIRGVL